MKYLLDTDHISFLQNAAAPEHLVLTARMGQLSPADFAFSVISLHEQLLGAHGLINRARAVVELTRGYALLNRMFQSFQAATVLPFDAAAGTVYAGLVNQRIRVGSMDLRIAAIALANGLTLLTRNVSDFSRVPGLVTEDWTK